MTNEQIKKLKARNNGIDSLAERRSLRKMLMYSYGEGELWRL